MRITESRLRSVIRSVIAENDQKEMRLSDPPEMMDFYISDDADNYQRRITAYNAAPSDFMNYGGEGKLFGSQQDFVAKMSKEIKDDLDYVLGGYNDYAENTLNKAYHALFNGRDREKSQGSKLSQTEYRYFDLEQLKMDIEENDQSLTRSLESLYSTKSNWSHYCGYQESAFA